MALPPEPSMSSPYGGIGAPPGHPHRMGSPVAAPGRQPSAAGYWIAGVVIVLGVVVALVWFVNGISNLLSAVDSYPRFAVPGQITTPLEAARYKVFVEYPGATTDISGVFRVADVTVTGSDGRPVPVSSTYTQETYSWHGHEGRSIAEFTPPTAGAYTVEATRPATLSSSTVRVAVGRGLQPSAVVPLFAAAGLGGLAVLVGIVLIVVTAVRRSRAKRRANPVPAFAAGPPGDPGGYPGAWGAGAAPGGYPAAPAVAPGQPAGGSWGVAPPVPPRPPRYVPPPAPVVPPGWGAAPGAPDPSTGAAPPDRHPAPGDPDPTADPAGEPPGADRP